MPRPAASKAPAPAAPPPAPAPHLVQALPVVAKHLLQHQQQHEEHQQGVAGQQEAHDGAGAEGCAQAGRQGRQAGMRQGQVVGKPPATKTSADPYRSPPHQGRGRRARAARVLTGHEGGGDALARLQRGAGVGVGGDGHAQVARQDGGDGTHDEGQGGEGAWGRAGRGAGQRGEQRRAG